MEGKERTIDNNLGLFSSNIFCNLLKIIVINYMPAFIYLVFCIVSVIWIQKVFYETD